MKQVLIITILLVVVGASFVFLHRLSTDQPIIYSNEVTTLYCPNEAPLTIQYSEDSEFAKLSLSGVQYELARAQTASGAKYESPEAGVSFWEHQGEVTVQLPGISEALICSLTEPVSEETWVTFAAETSNPPTITLQHPQAVSVSQVRDNIFEIKYIGPNSQSGTEITDGYFATIALVAGDDAEAYATSNNAEGSVATTSFIGYQTYTFTVESELANQLIQHHVFANPNADNMLVDVSYQVFGDANGSYQAELLKILNTLSLGSVSSLITIESPQAGTSVSSPITLSGEARGHWFFEASAPVVVTDWDGRIIGESFITADGEWMTEDFVPFTGTIEYDLADDSYSASGTVIFMRDNPSDLPENDAAVEIPVILR